MFPRSEYDNFFWNYGKSGDRHAKCFKPFNFKVIAARKAAFQESKQKTWNSSERVLHELVEGLQDLIEMDDSEEDDYTATALFQDFSVNTNDYSTSERNVRDVGHTAADVVIDEGS